MNVLTTSSILSLPEMSDSRRHCEFVGRLSRVLFRRRLATDLDDAEDQVRDCIVSAATRPHAYDGRRKFSSWFFTVLKNRAINRMKWRSRHRQDSLGEATEPESDMRQTSTESADAGRWLHECVRGLSDLQQQAIGLHFFDNFSCAEIAGLLGVSREAIRERIELGLKSLRKALGAKSFLLSHLLPPRD